MVGILIAIIGLYISCSFKDLFLFVCMYVCVCVCGCFVFIRPEEGIRCPEVVVTGSFEPPDMGAGNQTWNLYKSRKYS